jgi:hypothetical protein
MKEWSENKLTSDEGDHNVKLIIIMLWYYPVVCLDRDILYYSKLYVQ